MMIQEEPEILIVTEQEALQRLDKVLANRYLALKSRTYFQYLIEEGFVLLNGSPVKKRVKPKAGDEIQVQFVLTPEMGLEAEPIPLDIAYEDDHIIIVNKPAGMVVHPAAGNWTGTFVNALLHHCKELPNKQGTLRPGIVHRLDKDTTGLLLAAKSTDALTRLIEMFAGRKIYKEYLAICLGFPGDQKIEEPIGRHPVDRKRMGVVGGGKPALTLCKTLKTNGKISLVALELATGRTHQIRVHLKHINCPIIGDAVYGSTSSNQKYQARRQMLHAKKLCFAHPITGKSLQIEAPVPEDMQKIIETIG